VWEVCDNQILSMSRGEVSVRRAELVFAMSSWQIMMAPGLDLALTLASVPL
jgi:hypothetical protein